MSFDAFVRVLVVDDFAQWRARICSTLQVRKDLQVIGEAGNGPDAVEQAKLLKPDLILLDIGLPGLNGIEVAKRIHDLVPAAKILFVTQNFDKQFARDATSNGAQGYLLKSDATNLLPAIDKILAGERYLSEELGP